MDKFTKFLPTEILHLMFANTPVLIDVVTPGGVIADVNPCWEETLGWSQEELANHQPDVFAECFPDPQEHQEVLDFVFAARGEWKKFTLRTRTGRLVPITWAEFPLSGGRVLGIGALEPERKLVERHIRYLRGLFAPGLGIHPEFRLVSVHAQGSSIALLLLFQGKHFTVTVPVELVHLSASYGSGDLLFRMVQDQILRGTARDKRRETP